MPRIYDKDRAAGRVGGLVPPHDVDGDPLAFVPPARRELVRARIEALDAYIALDRPTAAKAVASAKRIGVALSTFYALARIWKERGDPRDLVGAGNRRAAPKARVLGDEEFIEQALGEIPLGRTIEDDVVALIAMADERGVRLRSVSALRRKVRQLRPYDRDAPRGDLVAAQIAVAMPVVHDGGAILPIAAILAHRPSARLVAVRLFTDPPGSAGAARVLLEGLRTKALIDGVDGGVDAIGSASLGGDDSAEWLELATTLERYGVRVVGRDAKDRAAGAALCARLLQTIGLKGHPRMGAWPVDRRRAKETTGLNVPVELGEAQAVVDARLANASPVSVAMLEMAATAVDLALALQPLADRR